MLRRLAPVVVLALAGACSESPSFSVRWKVVPYGDERTVEDAPDLVSVGQCTDLGFVRMRMTTRDANYAVVDEREFPCFPSEFAHKNPETDAYEAVAPGPEVGPGTYTVTLTAIGRRGITFCDFAEDDDGAGSGGTTDAADGESPRECAGRVLAWDAREIEITETGQNLRVPDFLIQGVPQCRDGVDNDRDGYTDLADPSCRGDRTAAESSALATAQVIVRPRFMGGNPNASCASFGVSRIEVHIDGPSPVRHSFACTTSAQSFTADLTPGDYTISVAAYDPSDEQLAAADLDPALAAFTLDPSGFHAVDLEADFAVDNFGDMEAGFAFSLQYIPEEEPVDPSCKAEVVGVDLQDIRVRLLDENGELVPGALVLTPGQPAVPLDGVTPIPCDMMKAVRRVEPLPWGPNGHDFLAVVVEAFPAGSDTPCYGNADAPAPAAPNGDFVINLPRLSDQGACAGEPEPP